MVWNVYGSLIAHIAKYVGSRKDAIGFLWLNLFLSCFFLRRIYISHYCFRVKLELQIRKTQFYNVSEKDTYTYPYKKLG